MIPALYAVSALVITCVALPIDQPGLKASQTDKVGCLADIIEGKGNFKLYKKHYTVKNPGFYIEDVKLLKRTSFYRCEPKELKFGVSENRTSWWVDKGCEGMFEILECPDIPQGLERSPEPTAETAKFEVSLIETVEVPLSAYDVKELQIRGIENRFHYDVSLLKTLK